MKTYEEYKKETIKTINSLGGKYSGTEIFRDTVTLMALMFNLLTPLSNKVYYLRKNEIEYIKNKYKNDADILNGIVNLTGLITEVYQHYTTDFLGELYMSLCPKKELGQAFTPFSVARLMAQMTAPDLSKEDFSENKPFTASDPTCGSGCMLIALWEEIKEKGLDRSNVIMHGQDLDRFCVYMAYVQTSLLGIPAYICCGNTLTTPVVTDEKDIYVTPSINPNAYYKHLQSA